MPVALVPDLNRSHGLLPVSMVKALEEILADMLA